MSAATAALLKALADQTRLRILSLIDLGEDLCGCEIEAVLRLSQSNASRHLAKLRAAGLVIAYKRAQWVHFRPDRETWEELRIVPEILEQVRAADDGEANRDAALLADYRASGYTCRTIDQWAAALRAAPDYQPGSV